MKEVIRTKLKISLPNDVFVAAYRIGKKENDAPDNTKILVRFTDKQQKNDLISAARTAKLDDLFVSENLTPTRQKIAYALRQANKEVPQYRFRYQHNEWSSLHSPQVGPPAAQALDTKLCLMQL